MRDRLSRNSEDIPEVYKTFRCRLVKQEAPLTIRKQIAGREQAKQSLVLSQTLRNKLEYYYDIYRSYFEIRSRREMLHDTYYQTGSTTVIDGSLVCSFIP